jgi:hypothetical protein
MTLARVHLYAWRPDTAAIPPAGREVTEPIRHGAWKCVLCRSLEAFDSRFCADCPGLVRVNDPLTVGSLE